MKLIICLLYFFITIGLIVISIKLGLKKRTNLTNQDNKNEFYKLTNIKSLKKKILIISILLVIFIVISIVLAIKVKTQDIEYQTIKCTVSNIERKREHIAFTYITQFKYKVKVTYNSIEYDLKNEDEYAASWKYKKGDKIIAYYKNNNIYANIEGVKGSTFLAKTYYISLAINYILVIINISFIIKYKKIAKKNQ